MSDPEALICAFSLDGKGGGRPLDWNEVLSGTPGDGLPWIHLHREAPDTRDWLTDRSGIPAVVRDALLADESRPRLALFPEGALLDLRGVNLNPGANPEDMVSIRAWIEAGRVVTVRRRKLLAIEDIRASIGRGAGPTDTGSFVVALAHRLVMRMGGVVSELDDKVDGLEDAVLTTEHRELRRELRELRRQAIALRRYIGPNREALGMMMAESLPGMRPRDLQRLREVSDRITRNIEDLDAARDRAALIQDELTSRLSEAMNRNMYMLSLIAGIFLPLSLITGLLGINVGGIPGEKWPWAFGAVSALLLTLGVFELWILRRFRWL